MKQYLSILSFVFLFTLVFGHITSTGNEYSITRPLLKAGNLDLDPCELISEASVKEVLEIPENVSSSIESTMRTFPVCFYKWESVEYSVQKTIGTQVLDINYPVEMNVVLVKEANQQMFETSTQVYRDGEEVSSIGESAMWGDKMSQLTFLSKGYLIHLYVAKSADVNENRKCALQIATKIIQNL